MRLWFCLILSLGCEGAGLTRICVDEGKPCALADDVLIMGVEMIGECVSGKVECDDDMEPLCVGYVGPRLDACDGLDNNCNGEIDEGFDHDRDGWTSCGGDCNDNNPLWHPGADEGCDDGDRNCDGEWIDSSNEVCDGVDNNCNGEIDEPIVQGCGPRSGIGVCRRGTQVCVGNETQCAGAMWATEEICDGLDNDCDNATDEGLARICRTPCGLGEESCIQGVWAGCTATEPSDEICDGVDNNCDGEADEGCLCKGGDVRLCSGRGLTNAFDGSAVNCGIGAQVCLDEEWGDCIFVGAGIESCNNWDDDCDGNVDNYGQPCGVDLGLDGIGECRMGTATCTAGLWGSCGGSVVPVPEICDTKDNDCNGLVDDGLVTHDKVDMCFAIDGSGSMCGVVNSWRAGLSMYISDFANTDHQFCLVMFPGFSGDYDVVVPLTDVAGFVSAVSGITCNRGGFEPSYDVVLDLSSAFDPAAIGWRLDAYPYIVAITDEPAQTNSGVTEGMVAANCTVCGIGSCGPGDRIETFVITQGSYASQWDSIIYFEMERLIEIYPAQEQRYADILRNEVFQNVCF